MSTVLSWHRALTLHQALTNFTICRPLFNILRNICTVAVVVAFQCGKIMTKRKIFIRVLRFAYLLFVMALGVISQFVFYVITFLSVYCEWMVMFDLLTCFTIMLFIRCFTVIFSFTKLVEFSKIGHILTKLIHIFFDISHYGINSIGLKLQHIVQNK